MARKILLADDSVTAQNMGRKILTDAGYEVVTVNNGSAALKKMAESKPDLIVLDVYMPGYSGLEVCQRIKENRDTARIPVLLTVGKLEPFKPEEARRARADAFVVKPFEASELLSALTKLEDKIIPAPEPYKPGRFARAIASVEQDSDEKFGDSDSGWKARLRIPTGRPKSRDAEPDVDYVATQGKGIRDLDSSVGIPPAAAGASRPREVDAKPGSHESAKPTAEFERPIPAGLPNDITPEEIAAITAAADQLRKAKVEPAPKEDVTKEHATQIYDAPPEMPVVEAPEEAVPVTFASSPSVVEAQPEPTSAPEISVADVVSPADAATEAAVAEPAPVDAVAETSVPAPVAESSTVQLIPPEAAPGPITLPVEEPFPEPAVGPQTEATPAPAAPEATTASTTDDEVMAALQTLMPSAAADSPTPASPESDNTPVPAWPGVETQARAAGPRWIAQEVPLADEEANLSLEQEMAQAHAAKEIPATTTAAFSDTPTPLDAISEEHVTSSETQEQPVVYAMASAAAAAGEVSTVPFASAGESSAVHENAILETTSANELAPAVPELEVAEPEAATTPPAGGNLESETVGGSDIMAANWKNIRDSIAGAAAKPAPKKEEFQETTPARTPEPEAPAASSQPAHASSADAAAEPAAPASAPQKAPLAATDPTAIANIVDSVLAELRPKIVEEIARKLSDPKK